MAYNTVLVAKDIAFVAIEEWVKGCIFTARTFKPGEFVDITRPHVPFRLYMFAYDNLLHAAGKPETVVDWANEALGRNFPELADSYRVYHSETDSLGRKSFGFEAIG